MYKFGFCNAPISAYLMHLAVSSQDLNGVSPVENCLVLESVMLENCIWRFRWPDFSLLSRSDAFWIVWPCIAKIAYDWDQQMHCKFPIFFNGTIALHVSGSFSAHYQERYQPYNGFGTILCSSVTDWCQEHPVPLIKNWKFTVGFIHKQSDAFFCRFWEYLKVFLLKFRICSLIARLF